MESLLRCNDEDVGRRHTTSTERIIKARRT
jgi:hypothetical protein